MTSHMLFGRNAAPVRVLGIDPGSTKHGVAILDVDGGRASLRVASYATTIEVSATLRTNEDRIDLVAIETSHGVHPGIARKRGVSAALSIAAASADATREAGILEGVALGLGLRVERCQAVEWRKAIIGDGQASDKRIADVIPRLVSGWPKRSSAHHRDAAGVALYVARRAMLGGRVA